MAQLRMDEVTLTGEAAGPRLFVEEWAASHGSPYLVTPGEVEEEAQLVEDGDRLARHAPPPEPLRAGEALTFVDGVRRGEGVLYHEAPDGTLVRGVAGAHACGAVACRAGAGAAFAEARVRRMVIWGCGARLPLPPVEGGFRWESHATAGADPNAPFADLQDRMRDGEVRLAEDLAREGHLVVLDGPLFFRRPPDLPVAGYVKTHSVRHLPAHHHARVPELQAGERTSMFILSRNRYSCYLRVARPSRLAGPWSGVVRLEVPAGAGLDAARAMADRLAALLPRYAGVPHRDPRAPQNLQPVGALEWHLRRLLGDARLSERAVREAVLLAHTRGGPA